MSSSGGTELFGEHHLPGVELEDGEHLLLVGVDEGLSVGVPADLFHPYGEGGEAGLVGGVAEVGEGELVLGVVEAGEVDGLGEVGSDVLPLGDQLFVDGVELVVVGELLLEPRPLDDGGLEEGGGGVGVVLEQLGRTGAVVGDVEAAVDGRRLVVPGPLDGGDGLGRDGELGVTLLVDDVLGGLEAHLLQGVSGGLEGVDLGGGELVAGGLVPVGPVGSRLRPRASGRRDRRRRPFAASRHEVRWGPFSLLSCSAGAVAAGGHGASEASANRSGADAG